MIVTAASGTMLHVCACDEIGHREVLSLEPNAVQRQDHRGRVVEAASSCATSKGEAAFACGS